MHEFWGVREDTLPKKVPSRLCFTETILNLLNFTSKLLIVIPDHFSYHEEFKG
jgi:hypothetical protein